MDTALATAPDPVLKLVDDWPWLNSQPAKRVTSVMDRAAAVAAMLAAPRGTKGVVVRVQAARAGVAPGAVHRWLARWRKSGIKGLADLRGNHLDTLPPKFISHVKGLFDVHQRADDGKEVHRALRDALAAWERSGDPTHAIPGYTTQPRRNPRTGLPEGWSYENIIHLCKPRGYTAAATKAGPKKASEYLPSVLTTRVGSAVLSRILFDDQDLDNLLADGELALSGITEAQRPASFNALDFYTAAHLDHHLRAVYRDPESGKKKQLTGQEFTWFVIHILQTKGYRIDDLGTELIFEHKTANTWGGKSAGLTSLGGKHNFDAAVHAILGGRVSVNRSGKFNTPLFAEMYFRPQSSGNFRFKTWIESAFRLLRTYMQALPGPTGSNQRLNGPEELHGIQHRERKLLTAISEHLDPHHASLIRHHLLSFQQFHELICAVYRAVNRRTDHTLEGWSQCGFTFPTWRPSVPDAGRPALWFSWPELEAIEDEPTRRMLIKRVNDHRDTLTRTERLSPDAAYQLETQRETCIRRLPDHLASLLLPIEWSVPKTVLSDHTFTLPNPLWPDTKDTYVGKIKDRGRTWLLEAGQKLRVFHNPFSDGRAHIHHPDGAYLGTIHPVVRATPFRPELAIAQLHTRSTIESGHKAEIRARMRDIAATRTADQRHNDRVLKGEPATPGERAVHRRVMADARTEQRAADTASDDAAAAFSAAATHFEE